MLASDAEAVPGLSSISSLLLVYVLGLAALATLAPFDFVRTPHPDFDLDVGASDVALNLGLLLPSGFLFRVARRGRGERHCLDVFVLGACVSLVLEGLQFFLPGRCPSPVDVLCNGLGAWGGAYLHSLLGPWIDRQLHRQLLLELPLTNVAYLSIPLLWLGAFAHPQHAQHVLALPIGAALAVVGAALYRHRAAPAGVPMTRAALGAAAAFAAGVLPGMPQHPLLGAAEVALVYAGTYALCWLGVRRPIADRRFEVATARRVLPLLLLYVALLGGYPWRSFQLLHPVTLGPVIVVHQGVLRTQVLALLESVAAFSLIGYVAAQLHARSRGGSLEVVARVTALGLPAAATFQWLCGAHADAHASVPGALLLGLAAAIGAGLHRAQLALSAQRRSSACVPDSGVYARALR